jgi:WD40 repeat protein
MRASSYKSVLALVLAIRASWLAWRLFLAEAEVSPNDERRFDYYGEPLPKGVIARLGTMRVRDPLLPFGPTTAFSPDGKILATGGSEHIRLWEIPSGKLLREIRDGERTKSYCSLVFSSDGHEIPQASRQRLRFGPLRFFRNQAGRIPVI